LEAKELWPEFRAVTDGLRGSVADARVAVEYSAEHEKAGSVRMYETLPLFAGRSTLEGVHSQASLLTHAVYYLASELGATSPNPFRKRDYSTFDTASALRHLRLFDASQVVALSPQLAASLDARPEARRAFRVPPYVVYDLADGGGGYVEPLAYAPVRSSPRGWRDKAYRWFTRKPLSNAYLVFSDDPRFTVVERDEWLAPPEVPLADGVEARATVGEESIEVTTNRVGHPLLVKVAYHPRWRAEGADGPYLVSPALMLIVPRQATVRLTYARTAVDGVGFALTVGVALGALVVLARAWAARGRPRALPAMAPIPLDECTVPPPTRRWGAVVPAALIVACVAARVMTLRAPAPDPRPLYERASRAYAAGRFADAAEYARHALGQGAEGALRVELRCLRGESLLRAGDAAGAAEAFQGVLTAADHGAYGAQALFGLAQARAAAGDLEGARQARERLLREYADSPWARRAIEATPAPPSTSG
jgi:hypothetical protein